MPHITIDYNAGIDQMLDISALTDAVHAAACGTGAFPIGGVRTLSRPALHSRVADRGPEGGFVQITVRIAPGRSDALKTEIVETLFAAANAAMSELFERRSDVALQLEVTEFDPRLTRSRNPMIKAAG